MTLALKSKNKILNINHAGTAMRFLTSFFSIQAKSPKTISGSLRMKQRPIKILVDALRNIGAEITYLEKEGFPPLLIKPSILKLAALLITEPIFLGSVTSSKAKKLRFFFSFAFKNPKRVVVDRRVQT